jgi:hypothetical protein
MKSLPSAHQFQPFLTFLQKNGISDPEFLTGILCQVNAISLHSRETTERGFLLSIIQGGNPKNQAEVLLLTQMAAVHDAVLTSARNLAGATDPQQVQCFTNCLAKLTRTFAAQMEVRHRCLSVNERNFNVQNVSIRDSAQAILGNVIQNSREDGSADGTNSTLVVTDQSGSAMPVTEPSQEDAKTLVKRRLRK